MQILHGDCLQLLKTIETNSVDAVVTDPPYELGFMGITQAEYTKYQEKWRKEQKEAEKRLARIYDADEEYYITVQYLLELASRSYELFMGSEPEQKREIIQLTLQNLQIKDGKLVYDWQKPFDSIFESAKRLTWGDLVDEIVNHIWEHQVNSKNLKKLLSYI